MTYRIDFETKDGMSVSKYEDTIYHATLFIKKNIARDEWGDVSVVEVLDDHDVLVKNRILWIDDATLYNARGRLRESMTKREWKNFTRNLRRRGFKLTMCGSKYYNPDHWVLTSDGMFFPTTNLAMYRNDNFPVVG